MEGLLQFVGENISHAPYIIFTLLILAGFGVPISEDAMLLAAGIFSLSAPGICPSPFSLHPHWCLCE